MVYSGDKSSMQRKRGHRRYRKPDAGFLHVFEDQPGSQCVARADFTKGR